MANVIGEMVVRVGVDTTNLNKGLAQGQSKMNDFATGMGKMGKAMMMGFSLPIAAAGVAVTKMAMDFETQMTNIYTLMDDATIKSRDWGQAVLDMSKKLGQSSESMSAGLYDIISSGFQAGDALIILEESAKAAVAGLSTTDVAVNAVTAVLNAYNLEATESKKVSDILFSTVNYGVVTFPELASSIGRVISTASAANVGFEEVGAAIAQMTLSGISADEAVTALNQVILNFLSPTDQAKDAAAAVGFKLDAVTLSTKGLGGAMAELIDKLGISTDELVEMERQGYTDEEMFDALAVKTGIQAETFAAIFSNVRALKGALALATNEGKNYAEMQDKMADSTGTASAAFEKQASTTKFQWDLAMSSIKAAGIELGQKLLPIASQLFSTIAAGANKFSNLSDETQNSILAWAGLLAVLPLVMVAVSKTITGITTLKTTLSTMNLAILGSGFFTKYASGLMGIGTAAASVAGQGAPALLWFSDIIGLTKTAQGEFGKAINLMKGVSLASNFDIFGEFGKTGPEGGGTWTMKYAGEVQDLLKVMSTAAPDIQKKALDMVQAFRESPQAEEDVLALKNGLAELSVTAEQVAGPVDDATKSIMQYRFANEELINVLKQVEGEYAQGLIDSDEYAKAVQYLASTNGTYKGSIQELYAELGIMSSEQLGLKESTDTASQALSDELDVVVPLAASFDDLLKTLYELYNLNQSVTESQWAYEDALKALDEVAKKHNATERETQTALFGVQDARESYTNAILGELSAEDLSAGRRQELIDLYAKLGLAAIDAGETSSTKFLEIAKAAGITKTELRTAIEEIGVDIEKVPKDIKVKTDIDKSEGEQNMMDMFGYFDDYEQSNPETEITAKTKTAEQNMDILGKEMLDYEMSNPETKIYADTSPAWGSINALNQYQIPSKTITLKYGYMPGFAHGGEVPGPAGVPRPAIVHGGEWVVNPFEPNSVNQFIDAMSGGKKSEPSTIVNKFEIAHMEITKKQDIQDVARDLLDLQQQAQRSLGK